ncbi:MAG TPA: hypothetical protein VEB86_01910, partial [Chryseosolibacter sp.]|nr:hypothetical protein [Chryseosolibacter sp.]
MILPVMLWAVIAAQAQTDIPIGTWRMHFSFQQVISVAIADDRVFAATEMAILVVDRDDGSLSTYTKLSGLSGGGISYIAFDDTSDQLVVTYKDGNIDIIHDNIVRNFSRLRDLDIGVTNKAINHIHFHNGIAYLSTVFGVVLYDLSSNEIRETWRDLGHNGSPLAINQSMIVQDSILLATDQGILAGNLNDNLLDYTKWRRYDTGVVAGAIESIAMFEGMLYAAIDNSGVYVREGSGFLQTSFPAQDFHAIESAVGGLIIVTTDGIWVMPAAGEFTPVTDPLISEARVAKQDASGAFWIGDSRNGLLSNANGGFESYRPNGPAFAKAFRITYSGNRVYAIAGGYTEARAPQGNTGSLSYFENGLWTTVETGVDDLTDIAHNAGHLFVASFGDGLLKDPDGAGVVYNEANSPLGD